MPDNNPRRPWHASVPQPSRKSVTLGLATVAALAVILGFAPSRSVAHRLLSLLRAPEFAEGQAAPRSDIVTYETAAFERTLILGEHTLVSNQPVVVVESLAEASALAGFEVRMPTNWMDMERTITCQSHTARLWSVAPDGPSSLLDAAGMDPALAPHNVGDGLIHSNVPGMVTIKSHNTSMTQMLAPTLTPTLTYPEGVDPTLMTQAALRIVGAKQPEAERISEWLDWGITLLAPLPSRYASAHETVVAGHDALLLLVVDDGDGRSTLIWRANGILTMLSHRGSANALAEMALTLYR